MATAILQKSLGAFYTGLPIARYIVQWALRRPSDSLLDPSCGDGVFLSSAYEQLLSLGSKRPNVCGIEVDQAAADMTKSRLPGARLIEADFFSVKAAQPLFFDAVVGNPPFIRYQNFNGDVRFSALARATEAGVKLPQLSSSWAPFLVHAVSFLKAGGRLGMVVPSELGHAQYARSVLQFLINKFGRIQICLFRKKLFPDLSEDTGLLFCEEFEKPCTSLSVIILDDIDQVQKTNGVGRAVDIEGIRLGRVRLIHYLLPAKARHLYEYLSNQGSVARLGVAADVGIGYVTGCNDYFHFSEAERKKWRIPAAFLRSAVLTLAETEAIRMRRTDWETLADRGRKIYLLAIPPLGKERLPRSILEYLKLGESSGVPHRFKCRVRDPWYSVPHVRVAEAFLTYMCGHGPRLVRNRCNLVAPNTLHLLRFETGWKADWFIGGWLSSLTKLSCELEGHALGGGMLKLEPSEAEKILVALPDPREGGALVRQLDKLTREKQGEAAADLADSRILRRRLGLSRTECLVLREAAAEMHKWRMHR